MTLSIAIATQRAGDEITFTLQRYNNMRLVKKLHNDVK
jgi:hypothetical protein